MALPESIREEVIQERLHALRQRRFTADRERQQRQQGGGEAQEVAGGVAPEFLAALPPEIQQEVLMQQQRTMGGSSAPPDAPADPNSFVRSLPDTLRRQVLLDMEDSQLGVLAQDYQIEARNLRRQVERQRVEAQERQASSGMFRQMYAMHGDPAPYIWGRHRHEAFDPLGFGQVR